MIRLRQLVTENLLCAVTCSFAAGIAVSVDVPMGRPLQIGLLVGTAALTVLQYHRQRSAAVMLFFGSLGILFGSDCYRPPADPSHIYNRVETRKEAIVIGTLEGLQGYDGQMSRAEVECDSIRLKGEENFSPATGRIRLSLKGIWPKDIMPGDQIVVRANLNRPHSLGTAGAFDYVHFLAEQEIWVTGSIESPLFIRKTQEAPARLHSLRYAAERVRMRLGDAFDQTLAPEIAGLYKAVVIGEWSEIDAQLLEKFKGTGCIHILSISGMHMSIIGVFLFTIFYWLLRRSAWLILHLDVKKTAALACLPPLGFYSLLAGSSTPVIRSLIMSAVAIFALCVNRRKSIFATLSLALLCLLVWRPANLFNVSFQLTFAAVASIAAISPFLVRLLNLHEGDGKESLSLPVRMRNWLLAALAVSVAATVGTAPILLFSFNRVSLVGPLANLVVEPLIGLWSLILGFLACPWVFLCPDLASMFLKMGSWGMTASIAAVTFFNGFPLASVWLPTPPPWLIATFYGALFFLLAGVNPKKTAGGAAWLIFLATLVFFVVPPSELLKYFKKDSTITFIDVGQGSASLLELPAGKRALVDGGGPLASKFNIGERVIGPFLWRKGMTKIDAVIVTHPDADHYNGLSFVVKHFGPETLWINGSAGHDRGYTDLLRLAKKMRVSIRVPAGDEQMLKTADAGIAAITNPLAPARDEVDRDVAERPGPDPGNDGGLIVKFTDGHFSALFPGDISTRVETLLIESPERLKSNVLLSPHHGSATSNSAAFLQAVGPEFLIVSAGSTRDGIFPARGLAEKSAAYGAKMLTTALNGCITVTTDGKNFTVATGNGIVVDRILAHGR